MVASHGVVIAGIIKSMLAIIGGTGLYALEGYEESGVEAVETEYGAPVQLHRYSGADGELIFLPRHGENHQLPPHKINYRANIAALKKAGVAQILAINSVGGIHPDMAPGFFAVPEQIIDYTWGRDHTFADGSGLENLHMDFTQPYTEGLRHCILQAFSTLDTQSGRMVPVMGHGVYGCTQGPRLESPAEINRMRKDGCDMVGMTGMPEAALASELGMDYAALCLSVNWAAGFGDEPINMDSIRAVIEQGMGTVMQIIRLVARTR